MSTPTVAGSLTAEIARSRIACLAREIASIAAALDPRFPYRTEGDLDILFQQIQRMGWLAEKIDAAVSPTRSGA